jgi:hypothetical protein
MIMSLDGYVEDEHGRFGWGAPEDEEVHTYVNQLASSVGTYLYGRRMYETVVYWAIAHTVPNQPQVVLDWARQWQAAEKIVYSSTLTGRRAGDKGQSRRRVPIDRLPRRGRRRKTVLPGSCAAEPGAGREAPVPQRRRRSAVRCPSLIDVTRH